MEYGGHRGRLRGGELARRHGADDLDIEEYSPTFEEYGPYICTGFAMGVLGIFALPFALEHQPRELSDVDYAGSTRSFIAGCIVLLASSSYFGAVSGVVAFISMVSRRSTSRSVAAVACFVAAFAIDTIFNPYMSWDEIGWVGAIFVVVVMVAGLLWAKSAPICAKSGGEWNNKPG